MCQLLRKLKNSNLSFFIWFLYIDKMKKGRKSSQESEGAELFVHQSQTTIFTIHLIILPFCKAFLKNLTVYRHHYVDKNGAVYNPHLRL